MHINDFLMLNVGFAHHNSDWNFKDINSPFARVYLVTDGAASVVIDGIKHNLTAGHMYIIPPFTTHTDICHGIFNHYYVHIYEESSRGDDILDSYEFPFEITGSQIDRLLFDRLVESNQAMNLKSSDPKMYDNEHSLIECVRFNRSRPLDVRMESMGIISQLLSRFIKHARPKYQASDERISQALKIINTRIYTPITVDELARETCMSVGHFIRLFRGQVGCTPAQFLIERKMMKAKLMLATKSLMTKEIAYCLGYDDVSYFTRLFKKHVGTTPRLYRQSYNKNCD